MKAHIVNTENVTSLSRACQAELFSRGYKWTGPSPITDYFECWSPIIIVSGDGIMFQSKEEKSGPVFKLKTQFGEWLDFLDAKPVEKSLGQVAWESMGDGPHWDRLLESQKHPYETIAKAVAEEAARRAAK